MAITANWDVRATWCHILDKEYAMTDDNLDLNYLLSLHREVKREIARIHQLHNGAPTDAAVWLNTAEGSLTQLLTALRPLIGDAVIRDDTA